MSRRKDLALNSHKQSKVPQTWRTQTGKVVQDSYDAHTIKFNVWYNAVDPQNFNYSPIKSAPEHMTVKWGRGNEAQYSDYRKGEIIGKVELPDGFSDKRDLVKSPSSSPTIKSKEYSSLQVHLHSPDQHTTNLVGRLNPNNDVFRSNARQSVRVEVKTDDLEKFHQVLSSIEENGVYAFFREIDKVGDKPSARCFTPLEVLAKILDPEFKFSPDAIGPYDYLQQFAQHFDDITSEIKIRAYSGQKLSDGPIRARIDSSASKSNRQHIDVGNGSR